jgi:hypothetical protein
MRSCAGITVDRIYCLLSQVPALRERRTAHRVDNSSISTLAGGALVERLGRHLNLIV